MDDVEKCENILAILSLGIKALARIILLHILEHILLLGTRPELLGDSQQDLKKILLIVRVGRIDSESQHEFSKLCLFYHEKAESFFCFDQVNKDCASIE